MAMGGAGALRTSAEFASQAAKPDDKAPWAQRRDTLSYTLQLLSRNPEDAARKFTMSLAIATEEVGLAELPNIQLGMRTLPSVHLQGALRKNASLKVSGVAGIAGGKLLAPTPVPYVPVESESFGGQGKTPPCDFEASLQSNVPELKRWLLQAPRGGRVSERRRKWCTRAGGCSDRRTASWGRSST